MATLYIAEFSSVAGVHQTNVGTSLITGQAPQCPPLAEQSLAISGSTNPSAAFTGDTLLVRVHTDSICSIAFGPAPTATANNMRLAANQTEYFGVLPGSKLAVVLNV